MAADCMRVRLHLRLIRVLAVLVDAVDVLVVSVASTRSWSRCLDCGFCCRDVHDTRPKKIRVGMAVGGHFWRLRWASPRIVEGSVMRLGWLR